MTHAGGSPKWEVRPDNTAPSKPNVLAQLSNDPTDGRFPLAILDKANFKDGELSVRTRAISGHVDQGAGLIWRYRDPNNYYLVRANALENNVTIYHTVKGAQFHCLKGTAKEHGSNTKCPQVGTHCESSPTIAVRSLFQWGENVGGGGLNFQ
jgi:hypothetical protein